MDNITLGQVFTFLGYIAGVIGSISVIAGVIIKYYQKKHKEEETKILEQMSKLENKIIQKMNESDGLIHNQINEVKNDIVDVDINQCKNFLVQFMGNVEQGKIMDSSEVERAYESMDRYTNVLHQNSYIHKRWEEIEPYIKTK